MKKTAVNMEKAISGAAMGALAGAIAGSRRSLDERTLAGMQQGAVVGALSGAAAAQFSGSKGIHFLAGGLGGAVGSRGPRGPSRPQLHLRMDRHITNEQEPGMQGKIAALRASYIEKLALSPGVVARAAAARGVSIPYLKQVAKSRKSNASIRRSATGDFGERAKSIFGTTAARGKNNWASGGAGGGAGDKPFGARYLESWKRNKPHAKIAEGNFGHGAELAGLAMLAAPSIQHFRGKPMSDRKSHVVNAAGLAVLAAPSLLALAKRQKKHASSNFVAEDVNEMSRRGGRYGAGIGAINGALAGKSLGGAALGAANGWLIGRMAGAFAGRIHGMGRMHQERLHSSKKVAADEKGNALYSPQPKTTPTVKTDADCAGDIDMHPLARARLRRFNTLNAKKE